MTARGPDFGGTFVLAERQFTGTPEEQIAQLDETIEALLGFRSWLLANLPHEAQDRTGLPAIAYRLRHLVRFSSVALLVLGLPALAADQPSEPEPPPVAQEPAPPAASGGPLDQVRFGAAFQAAIVVDSARRGGGGSLRGPRQPAVRRPPGQRPPRDGVVVRQQDRGLVGGRKCCSE